MILSGMWIYMAHEKSIELGISTQAITLNPLWAKKSKAPWENEVCLLWASIPPAPPPQFLTVIPESPLCVCIMLSFGMCDIAVQCISMSLGYSLFLWLSWLFWEVRCIYYPEQNSLGNLSMARLVGKFKARCYYRNDNSPHMPFKQGQMPRSPME